MLTRTKRAWITAALFLANCLIFAASVLIYGVVGVLFAFIIVLYTENWRRTKFAADDRRFPVDQPPTD